LDHFWAVEFGGYVGYSCILFGDAVRKAGGQSYFSLERNPEFAAVIASLVDLAGLSDLVKVIVGSSGASIRRLHAAKALHHIDLMFLDHYKPAYTTDLKLCEELGFVTPGTVLVADNVITPGNPPYLGYVRSSVVEKHSASQYSKTTDGVDTRFKERVANQYMKREGAAKLDSSVKGNPNLVYESKLINSFEPSGEAVSSWKMYDSRLSEVLTIRRTALKSPGVLQKSGEPYQAKRSHGKHASHAGDDDHFRTSFISVLAAQGQIEKAHSSPCPSKCIASMPHPKSAERPQKLSSGPIGSTYLILKECQVCQPSSRCLVLPALPRKRTSQAVHLQQ
jgi:predicted O-methyltransferase YrrM